MDNEHTGIRQWSVPTREARELILAEEILRFTSITDRPDTSRSAQESKLSPDSTAHNLNQKDACIDTSASSSTSITERLDSEIADTKVTLPATSVFQKTMHIAPLASTSGSDPIQSAAGNVQALSSKYHDTPITADAAVPIDHQQNARPIPSLVFRSNTIPVTNHLLTAVAQSNEFERSASNSPVILQPNSVEMDEYWPNNNEELFAFFLDHLKRMQVSDLSRSSSPDSQAASRSGQSTSTRSIDEISKLNQRIQQTAQLEEIIIKTMQNEQDETEEEDEDCQQANSRDEPAGDKDVENDTVDEEEIPEQGSQTCADDDDYTTATTPDASEYQEELAENLEENYYGHIDDNNPNDRNAQDHQVTGDEAEPSEFPGLDDASLRFDWARPEKRRLTAVLRDLSREIKIKELNHKKARLLKKGRVIAKAIENKICAINKEITSVNKKSLRHVALPLDQMQDYDWEKVANVLNAKRTPQECRMYWELFLHPSINTSEWTQTEIKAMEVIAQRHNFRNWGAIAEELNTGRNGQQCYLFYRQHLCPHTELRRKCNK